MLRGLMRRRTAGDEGFTLVEVVVALALLSIVAVSAGLFMVQAFHSSRTLQDQQAAVQVARQVFEDVQSIAPTKPKTESSPLVRGRGKTDVTAQWTQLATEGIDISDTYTGGGSTTFDSHAYDATITGVSVSPKIPLTGTKQISNIDYDYQVAIGTCTRPRESGECGTTGTGDELFRVVVVVEWQTGPGQEARRYVTSTLFDPSLQPKFNASRKPYAYDDEVHAYAGELLSVPVLLNDKGSWALNGAVTVSTAPNKGGSAALDPSSNNVNYTPGNYTGDETFTYKAVDTNGISTNYATVLVHVHPSAIPDTYTMTNSWAGTAASIPVLANDRGTLGAATVAITAAPTGGATAIVSGQSISFTAPVVAAVSTYQFKYRVTALGLASKDALVSVTVNPPPPPTASPTSVTAAAGKPTSVDLAPFSSPAGAVYTSTTPGVTFNGSVMTGTPTAPGTMTIPYTVTDKFGRSSSSTVTVTVVDPLVVRSVSRSVRVSTSTTITPSDYLVSGSLKSIVVSRPSYSTATVSGTSVTVSRSVSGTGTFTVTATDVTGATATFTITLTTF